MSTEVCFQHPARAAVEHCEVCRRPVCGSCLWYAESGERLCPEHAAQFQSEAKAVIPPERYAEGIAHSQASAGRPPVKGAAYQGNSTDLSALLAAVVGLLTLLSCMGLSWVIPLLAVVLGLASWLQSREAVDPLRTRWLAGLGLATSGVVVLFFVGFVGLMFACLLVPAVMTSLIGPRGVPTPAPFP